MRGIGHLHQEVWKFHNGEIPKGMHIHHKDGNPLNNEISNLEILTPRQHRAHHPIKDMARHLSHLESIRPMSKAWHASDAGRKWHSENAKKCMKDRAENPVTLRCQVCGETFLTVFSSTLFCSNACRAKNRRDTGVDDESRECAVCGSQFTINKYRPQKCCSRHCGGILREKQKATTR